MVMDAKSADFWGLTSGFLRRWHLQSYFMVFRKNVFTSEAFRHFWSQIRHLDNKLDIIETYEVELTQLLCSQGFKADTFYRWSPKNRVYVFKYVLKACLKLPIIVIFLPKVWWLARQKNQKAQLRVQLEALFFPNKTLYFWRALLLGHFPFIKVELLRDNPTRRNLKDFEEFFRHQNSQYPLELIKNHLSRLGKSAIAFQKKV